MDLSTPSKRVQLLERNHLDVTIKFATVISSAVRFFHSYTSRGPHRSQAENGVGQLSKTYENVCMSVLSQSERILP